MVASSYTELNNTYEEISNKSLNQNQLTIPVKMGSNKMLIRLKPNSNKSMTARDLIETVLKKCKMITNEANKIVSTYTVFECFRGIERMIDSNESIFDLVSKWNQFTNLNTKIREQTCFEFVIRKLHAIEKRTLALSKRNMNSVNNKVFIKCCYKKLKTNTPIKSYTFNEPEITELVKDEQIKNVKKRKATQSETNYVKKFKELIHIFENKLTSKQFVEMMFEKCKKQKMDLHEKVRISKCNNDTSLNNSKLVLIDAEIF